MVKLSPEVKKRLTAVVGVAKFTFQWGFVPTVLYLGFKTGADEGMPDLSILSLLWQ